MEQYWESLTFLCKFVLFKDSREIFKVFEMANLHLYSCKLLLITIMFSENKGFNNFLFVVEVNIKSCSSNFNLFHNIPFFWPAPAHVCVCEKTFKVI